MSATARIYYSVAEHIFALECEDKQLLPLLAHYEAFMLSSAPDDGEPIFVLRIATDGSLSDAQKQSYTHIFTDSSDADMPRIEVYGSKDTEKAWWMRISQIASSPICCEIEMDAHFKKAVLRIGSQAEDGRFCIDNALMLLYAFSTAGLMTLEMHASVVVRADMGYLFLGHSGTGKSTHARQWLQAFPDAWLLNDDNPIVRVMADGEVRVYGSPWSGKTPCYKQAYARVGGIVKLSQAPHNRLRSLSLPEAYAAILSSASGLKMEKQMADSIYESIKHVVTHVACYHLECLPNTAAAELCYGAMRYQ